MQEFEKDQGVSLVDPAADVEHSPIEMDPVADFEKARAAIEEQMKQLNRELEEARAARDDVGHERDLLIIQRDTARKERDKVTEDLAKAAEKIYALRRKKDNLIDEHEREKMAWRKQLHKPILWQCLAVFGFAVLSMLIGLAVSEALVDSRLGEPLAYGCLGISAFFGGIIWERLRGGCCGRRKTPAA